MNVYNLLLPLKVTKVFVILSKLVQKIEGKHSDT